jgi:NAD(P)-dependent dehydrogenase (short-subunit alcohol dehydrogenase family)
MTATARWFITGVSTGFGREMARELVRTGRQVVGTVRQEAQRAGLEAEGIGTILMDVTNEAEVNNAVTELRAKLGGIDVVVNNAGFGLTGAIEALSLDEIRSVMDTNFYGVVRVTRAFLPMLREHGGTFVNISSMAGQIGFAGMGAYNASKFALEGLSQALAEEVAPFGIRVLIVEPGAFRTDFSGRSARDATAAVPAYANTQGGEIGKMMGQYHGSEPGDPLKAVQAIIKAVESDSMPLRLPLGADAVAGIEDKLQRLKRDMDEWRAASLATAFDS